ncbi:putative reverse transcriptase domain-containing protein [Tanacetum coccineum]
MLMCCEPDTAYGLHPIQRISDESALAVEIDFTWSLGFGSVEPGRPLIPLSSASVEARISLFFVQVLLCLFTDSAMNLVSDSSNVVFRSKVRRISRCCVGRESSALLLLYNPKVDRSGNGTFRVKDLSSGNIEPIIKQDYFLHISQIVLGTFHQDTELLPGGLSQYAVLTIQNTPYCLEEQLRCLDCRIQYVVQSGKVDRPWIRMCVEAKSKANVVADALSRKERVEPKRVRAMNMTLQLSIKDRILAAQKEVPLKGNVRTLIMDEAHKSKYFVHPGADKMYYDLRDMYWWSGIKKDIAVYVSKCLTCLEIKAEHQRPSSLLQLPKIPEWKWKGIAMDFMTKLHRTSSGHATI